MRKTILWGGFALSLLSTSAHAATLAVTPGSGANLNGQTDGSGNFSSRTLTCDATNPDNCGPVDTTKGVMGQSVDGGHVTIGTTTDAAYTSGSGTLVAILKGIYTKLSSVVLAAGSAIIGKVGIDQTTPGTTNGVQVNAALPAGTNLLGKTGIDQTTPGTTNGVSPVLLTSGGWTPWRANGLTNSAVSIKGSAGQLGSFVCANQNTGWAYVQVFNVASGSVTVGTTAPTQSFAIPPGGTAGFAKSMPGTQYSAAMSIAATTTATGGTAPSTALDCDGDYN